ncbi:MAG TPA: TorF family putative porin [Ignavibacteriales bacterium]|nr:TorF family putative porin [Ignavibacteriales bacterium]
MRSRNFYLPVVFFISFLMTSSLLLAQDAPEDSSKEEAKPYSFSFGADLVSRYVWRGIEVGESMPQVQPYGSFDLDLKSSGSFSLGLWGSYGFTGNYAENDFYLKYSYETSAGTFSATATDYYYPYIDSLKLSDFKNNGEGAHTMEAAFLYTGPEAFPVSFTLSKNFYNDIPGQKSLYVELGYPVAFNGTSLNFFAGAAQGPSVWHSVTSDQFQVINLGFNVSKEIKITQDFSLPVGLSFIMNPHIKNTYVVFKVSL